MTAFVVISHGRSGSTLLTKSLDLHPDVSCPGEVFNAIESHRVAGRSGAYQDGDDPVAFCREELFPIEGETQPCCGFKLHFNQMRQDENALALWTWLESNTDIRVILLRRENLFDSYVSQQRAMAAGKWRRRPDQPVPEAYIRPIAIDPQHCLRNMRNSSRRIEETWACFQHHSRLQIAYENLAGSFQPTMDEVWAFLGVAPLRVDPPLARMNVVDHATGISNFAEICEALAGTEFAGWVR